MMAAGKIVSLAIPVLTSIYRGLNLIARSRKPSRSKYCFPVHFVYGWLAKYYDTHDPIPRGSATSATMVEFSGVERAINSYSLTPYLIYVLNRKRKLI